MKNLKFQIEALQGGQVWYTIPIFLTPIKCLTSVWGGGDVTIRSRGGVITGIFSYPNQQIYFTINMDRAYVYSTGLVLRALKIPSRAFRRQNSGHKVYFLFLLKKLQFFNSDKDFTLVINSLKGWGVLKRFYTRFSGGGVRNWLIINPTFNFRGLGLKKLSSIKRRLRKKFIVE